MARDDLVASIRTILRSKTKGFKVFFASGLNTTDTKTYWGYLTEEERALTLQLYNISFNPATPAKDVSDTDPENMVAMFNALFESASNVSAIANVYSGAPDIIAIFHSDHIEENDIQVSVENPGDDHIVTVKLNTSNVKYETSQISRRSYWPKNRRDGIYGQSTRNSYSPLEYLTVLAVSSDGSNQQILTRNFAVLANYSFIVDSQGEIKRQKYGEPSKFIDVEGINHREVL